MRLTAQPSLLLLDTIREPMLASKARPEDLTTLVGTHSFEEKSDGIRGLLAIDSDGSTVLRNRSGTEVTERYPEIELAAMQLPRPLLLDGEIVAASGSFEDIAWRDKQKGRGATHVPARLVAFDVLVHPDEGDVRHQPYAQRRLLLQGLELGGTFDTSLASPDPGFFDRIVADGGEGVVAKRLTSRYHGGRSTDWLKIKSLHRLTALVLGFQPGNGSRAEMGAAHLALIDFESGRVVPIGKVGSGFTEETARRLREEVVKAVEQGIDITGVPIVEVECLGVTKKSGVLRQPVFKGFRTDLDYIHCTYDQIERFPRS